MLLPPPYTVHPSHPVASIGGTSPMHPRQHNSSLSASPFDPSFLHALGQQTSPTEKEDLLSDSLGMLSTVAMYHGELSSSLGTPIQNKMANVRITSSYGESLCIHYIRLLVAIFTVSGLCIYLRHLSLFSYPTTRAYNYLMIHCHH